LPDLKIGPIEEKEMADTDDDDLPDATGLGDDQVGGQVQLRVNLGQSNIVAKKISDDNWTVSSS
tara:strand:- start:513 stop:704 length:192 start_codon:yes stop_codon:yes gene_type:complete